MTKENGSKKHPFCIHEQEFGKVKQGVKDVIWWQKKQNGQVERIENRLVALDKFIKEFFVKFIIGIIIAVITFLIGMFGSIYLLLLETNIF